MKVHQQTLNYYNSKATDFIAGTIDVDFTEIQNAFLNFVPMGSIILDFGCGSGRDTKYFSDKGYQVEAKT